MPGLTSEEFESWWHPSDALDQFIALGDKEAREAVLAMLRDGLIAAVAEHLVVSGLDKGLTLIPRETWSLVTRHGFWSTSRFRIPVLQGGEDRSISAYGIRLDPAAIIRLAPPRPPRAMLINTPEPLTMPAPRVSGGRPPAKWWDDLWIEICRQIYVGDLKPDDQAVIERAMHDWIARQGFDAGETTVRARATRLFAALSREVGN